MTEFQALQLEVARFTGFGEKGTNKVLAQFLAIAIPPDMGGIEFDSIANRENLGTWLTLWSKGRENEFLPVQVEPDRHNYTQFLTD